MNFAINLEDFAGIADVLMRKMDQTSASTITNNEVNYGFDQNSSMAESTQESPIQNDLEYISANPRRESLNKCVQAAKSPLSRDRSFSVVSRNHNRDLHPDLGVSISPRLNYTRHFSLENAITEGLGQSRLQRSVDMEETDYHNDVSQWNLENMMEMYFRENKGTPKETHKRRRSEWTPNRQTAFVFPPTFTKNEGEQFMKKRFNRRNAVCIYDHVGFSKFLATYISTKHMMTFCI